MKLLAGFMILGLAVPAFAQYAAPAILSRGEAPSASSAPNNELNYSVTLTSDYTNGLAGLSLPGLPLPGTQDQLTSQSAFGGGVVLRLDGAHNWNRSHLDFSYSGSFKQFSQATQYDGLSQGLSFGLTERPSPRTTLTIRESAGLFSHFLPDTVALNSSAIADPSQIYAPPSSPYNDRTIFSTTQANLIFQETARLSFNLGGTYFLNERQPSGLSGAAGVSATGDVQYRLSPHTTIGAEYNASHFSYTQGLGGAFIHAAAFTAAWRMTQSMELSFFAGPSRMETNFVQSLAIDPAIQAVLCPPKYGSCPVRSGVVIFHQVGWGPNFSVRFSRSFHRSTAFISAGESATPGNGSFLTSQTKTAAVGYSFSGLRDWSVNVGATYMTALSLGNVNGNYRTATGSFGASRQIVGGLRFVSSLTAIRYRSPTLSGYNRMIYTASLGFGFSSGSRPGRPY